jgi:cystathionine beta-lyase/cystathionine gamma-synthase
MARVGARVVGGAAVVRDPELAERIGFLKNAMATRTGPQNCFLVLRRIMIMTLALRMEEHNRKLRYAGP